ncbi:MAG: hypothetical protein AUG46_09590 [Acidobacteria bacterium 13_1_20CM_3_58_11]|nr:MAG: hypothetical protein AUG46_09590 [Acidobacteria bacterium 13_1_20CM_3_58_11]
MNDRSAQMALMGAGSVGLGMAIVRFAGKAVDFAGGRSEGFDLMVAATGHGVSFPFLPPGLAPVKGSVLKLGVRLPPTHLIDARAALRRLPRGKWLLELLPGKQRKPRRKRAPHDSTPPVFPAKPTTDPRVEVFQ